MVASLELRRRAIVEALRAVMAEPLRAPAPRPIALQPLEPTQPVEYVELNPIVNRDRKAPSAVAKPGIPTLRDSLTASIDWDEVESIDLELAEALPVAAALDDADDAIAPPIPPIEFAGTMSSTASMALFGHE